MTTTPNPEHDDQATDPTAETDGANPETETASPDVEAKAANREAARYRRQFREAETQRQHLAAHVERLQRAEVVRLASEHLEQPDDLFDVGRVALADLLDDDGMVQTARVESALLGLLSSRPGLGRDMVRRPGPGAGFGQGSYPAVPSSGKSWSGLIREG